MKTLYSASGLLSVVEYCPLRLTVAFRGVSRAIDVARSGKNCSRIPNIKLKFIELASSITKPPLKVSSKQGCH